MYTYHFPKAALKNEFEIATGLGLVENLVALFSVETPQVRLFAIVPYFSDLRLSELSHTFREPAW